VGDVLNDALFVFDEGPGAGLGHRRRCEALARVLDRRGVRCTLEPLGRRTHWTAPIVVVDSYHLRADDPAVFAAVTVAIDDLHRDLAVDLVVDPSPGADAARHIRAHHVCAGAPYAVVTRPNPFPQVRAADGRVDRVLVTTGGSDAAGTGAALAAALHDRLPDAAIRLVLGPWGDDTVPAGVEAVRAPSGLADEFAAAPLVVTAGGVSLLEACMLRRAIVAVMTAENQRVAVESLAAAGAVVAADPDHAAAEAAMLAADPMRRLALAERAGALVDGRGPDRVADALLSLRPAASGAPPH
jgi:spore coat polysaccharide biosynthesis predicted glycosyltransferase SpsG